MLRVILFGKFSATFGGRELSIGEGSRAQELFSFLLLNRGRLHPREAVASRMWGECTTARSKAYLRKAIWQLRKVLEPARECDAPLLCVETDWVGIPPDPPLWLDVAVLEAAYERVAGVEGWSLDPHTARQFQEAVNLYGGDLLENRYDEWCLVERERLRHLYLIMLDKLMAYAEEQGEYEAGILHGMKILQHDTTREHTRRRLMCLHALRGNRAAALRQYQTCVAVLQEELGVGPSELTVGLHEEIRNGTYAPHGLDSSPVRPRPRSCTIQRLLLDLDRLQAELTTVQEGLRSVGFGSDGVAEPPEELR